MPKFSVKSRQKLASCETDLQMVFNTVVEHFDCTVTEGFRGKEAQDGYYAEKRTKVRWPHSKHNAQPSRAVDVVPYPVDYNDRERMHFFAGFVLGTAAQMGVEIRWGGDWDSDTEVDDNSFDDLPHFELR